MKIIKITLRESRNLLFHRKDSLVIFIRRIVQVMRVGADNGQNSVIWILQWGGRQEGDYCPQLDLRLG